MISAAEVAKAYEITEPATAWLDLVVQAVNTYVDALPDVQRTDEGEWAETTHLGALMLAARMYDRRDSRGGVMNVGESTSFVARYDPDISRLLRIDAFAKPKVA